MAVNPSKNTKIVVEGNQSKEKTLRKGTGAPDPS